MRFFRSLFPGREPVALPRVLGNWFADQGSVSRYREMVTSPVFRTAEATLTAAAQPTQRDLRGTPEEVARRMAWLAGYQDAFRDLQRLAHSPAETPADELRDEWGYIDENYSDKPDLK